MYVKKYQTNNKLKLTSNNLIEFFKVLTLEEQNKFMELAHKLTKPKKLNLKISKKPCITQQEAILYLIKHVFNK